MRSLLNNKQPNHLLPVTVILVAVILVVYYPAMSNGINSFDDPGIIALYSKLPPIFRILSPGDGFYYRPLLELSFWLDSRLWGMEPSVMHLENILLHCANSLLVFLLARRASACDVDRFPLIPLLCSLLFALHPVNVEAVVWIAGRSDPLLSFFALSALLFWLHWLDESKPQDVIAALMLFAAALLTKETALAGGLVGVLLAVYWPGAATVKQRMSAVGAMSLPIVFLVVYSLVFRGGSSALTRVISGADLPAGPGWWGAVTAFGFYVKKLVVPVPLNFAITEVHPLYGLVGAALLPLLYWTFRSCRQAGVIFVSAALLILPAVMVAVKQVAWTPFAERYMYLPSALCAVGLSIMVHSCMKQSRRAIVCMMLAVCSYSFFSVSRVMLWNNKLAFIQDAISNSPDFGILYDELGVLLLQGGETDRAGDALATADRLNKRPSVRLPIKANLMGIQMAKGNYSGARELFFQVFNTKNEAPADFLELLFKADNKRIHTLSGKDKVLLAEELLETLDLLNQKRPDPFWLYQSGQLSLMIIGDKARAADFYFRAYTAAPADAHYRGAAETHLRKLGCIP